MGNFTGSKNEIKSYSKVFMLICGCFFVLAWCFQMMMPREGELIHLFYADGYSDIRVSVNQGEWLDSPHNKFVVVSPSGEEFDVLTLGSETIEEFTGVVRRNHTFELAEEGEWTAVASSDYDVSFEIGGSLKHMSHAEASVAVEEDGFYASWDSGYDGEYTAMAVLVPVEDGVFSETNGSSLQMLYSEVVSVASSDVFISFDRVLPIVVDVETDYRIILRLFVITDYGTSVHSVESGRVGGATLLSFCG